MTAFEQHSPWFDPRLTVFIIWGTFILIFICIPIKRMLNVLCRRMGCRFPCCTYVEEDISRSNENGGGVVYELLSRARKREIDSLRASHITYRLHPFTLTLEENHLSRCTPDTEPSSATSLEDDNANLPQDRRQDSTVTTPPNDDRTANHVAADDVETGFVRSMDAPHHQEGKDCVEYTHISIPLPGHDFHCVDVYGRDEVEKEPNDKEEKKPRIRLFGGKDKLKVVSEDPVVATEDDETIKVKGGRRSCPIFCAICLAEYEPSERVSWSSNPDCTHAFHEDCVVEWLVTLGRTKSKHVRFLEEPTEAQLLHYHLECPCCRQDFVILKEQRGLPNV